MVQIECAYFRNFDGEMVRVGASGQVAPRPPPVIPPLAGTGQLGHQGEQSVRFLWFGIGTKYWDGRIDRVPARGKSCTSLLYII